MALPVRLAPANGRRDLASFDEVPLRDAEHEIAGGRVGLSAAQGRDVDPSFGRREDVVGLRRPVQDVGVGHARDGGMRVGLAPTVPGRGHAVLLGPEAVVHQALQRTVLEQDGALARHPFVVEGERPPRVRDRRVVDARDERRREQFADAAPVDRRLLVHDVRLERMPAGLVEQHAAHPGREDHRHLAGRRGSGVEHRHRALRSDLGRLRRRVLVEELHAGQAGRPVEPRLDDAVAPRDHLDPQPDPRTRLLHPPSVGRGDEHLLDGIAVGRAHLADVGAEGAGDVVDRAQPRHLLGGRDGLRRSLGPVDDRRILGPQVDHLAGGALGHGSSRGRAASSSASGSSRLENA